MALKKLLASGTGLITLDIIMNGKIQREYPCYAGGSTGNVLTILAYFGWDTYPIGYIGDDAASNIIIRDMETWGVKTNYLIKNKEISTPIILEQISKKGHYFKFKCPECNNKYPRNRVLPKEITEDIVSSLPNVKVFYFDRLSKSLLSLLESLDEEVIVFFEPHRVSKINLFKKVLKYVDIIKYSEENISKINLKHNILLEIKTMGDKGLLFKHLPTSRDWREVSAYTTSSVVDAAGSGDWLSAALIDQIGRNHNNLLDLDISTLLEYLDYGLRLSALNCKFEGPRSVMYHMRKQFFSDFVTNIYSKNDFPDISLQQSNHSEYKHELKYVCPNCSR